MIVAYRNYLSTLTPLVGSLGSLCSMKMASRELMDGHSGKKLFGTRWNFRWFPTVGVTGKSSVCGI